MINLCFMYFITPLASHPYTSLKLYLTCQLKSPCMARPTRASQAIHILYPDLLVPCQAALCIRFITVAQGAEIKKDISI